MKRQGLKVSVGRLKSLVDSLEKELSAGLGGDDISDVEVQINIINKEGLSDTWEIEE